jgi:hypothetical protein
MPHFAARFIHRPFLNPHFAKHLACHHSPSALIRLLFLSSSSFISSASVQSTTSLSRHLSSDSFCSPSDHLLYAVIDCRSTYLLLHFPSKNLATSRNVQCSTDRQHDHLDNRALPVNFILLPGCVQQISSPSLSSPSALPSPLLSSLTLSSLSSLSSIRSNRHYRLNFTSNHFPTNQYTHKSTSDTPTSAN